MKGKTLGALALSAAVAATLASCKAKMGFNYADFEVDLPEPTIDVATSGHSSNRTAAGFAERTKALAALEDYAIKEHLTGITLYEDGGLNRYSSNVVFPTKLKEGSTPEKPKYTYVNGYGFGLLEEGSLKQGDTFRQYESSDIQSLNYANNKGSVVANYIGYVQSSYFGTRLTESKDAYEYYGSLASDVNQINGKAYPLPVGSDGKLVQNPSEEETYKKYRIYVRTGKEVKYGTLSTDSKVSGFNGREVKLEDYLTPFKNLWNQSVGLARGAEGLEGAQAIVGAAAYYNATSKGFDEEAWNNVGIKASSDDKGDYLEIEYVTPCIPFYASYYVNSQLYAPIPQEFIDAIGGAKIVGSYNSDKSLSPVDTTLSTGAYCVKSWETDKKVVFQRNPQNTNNVAVLGGSHRYNIDKLQVAILTGLETDKDAAWKEFEKGALDIVTINSNQIQNGWSISMADVQQVVGASTTKLNVNTATQEEWDYLFGANGVVAPGSEWDVKPIMSNDNFINGLSYAINRKEYAENRGATPSAAFFSDNYISNPLENTSYNSTEEHKALMKKHYGEDYETNFGFNAAKATELFAQAAKEEIAKNNYKKGDTITIEVMWQAEAQIDSNGTPIAKYIKDAWDAANTGINLEIKNDAVAKWDDIYYKKMLVGQFDIAFGGISGNSLNPLNFMEILMSDNSSGFTLNYGPNTNDINSSCINFDGKEWTFDALYKTYDRGCVLDSDNQVATVSGMSLFKNMKTEDGGRTLSVKYAVSNIPGEFTATLDKVVLCWYSGEQYEETVIEDYTNENGVITFTISKELAERYQEQISVDLIFTQKLGNAESQLLLSATSFFPVWEELHD